MSTPNLIHMTASARNRTIPRTVAQVARTHNRNVHVEQLLSSEALLLLTAFFLIRIGLTVCQLSLLSSSEPCGILRRGGWAPAAPVSDVRDSGIPGLHLLWGRHQWQVRPVPKSRFL